LGADGQLAVSGTWCELGNPRKNVMTQTLRLVSYNLLEGLRPIASPVRERRHFDRARVEAARAVVDGLRPDVLVLNEALFCQEHRGRVVDYSRLFGFPYLSSALTTMRGAMPSRADRRSCGPIKCALRIAVALSQ